MKKAMTVSFPPLGKYTPFIVEFLEETGFKVLRPPPVTKHTIELGTKYAPSDICFPLKATLGNMIEEAEKGAEALFMASTGSWCILRNYWIVQEQVLNDLGFKFKMVVLNLRRPFKTYSGLKKINPKLNMLKLLKATVKFYKKIKQMDLLEKEVNTGSQIKIGLIGEIYCVMEDTINMDIVKFLQDLGCYVDRWLTLSEAFRLSLKNFFKPLKFKRYSLKKHRKAAEGYFPDSCGGHANENLVRMIDYTQKGYDGIICLEPLFCHPESIMETSFKKVSKDFNIPFLKLSIDEFTEPIHYFNRVEAFIESIKFKKKCISDST